MLGRALVLRALEVFSYLSFTTNLAGTTCNFGGVSIIIPISQDEESVTGFPGGSVVNHLPANAGDLDSIPGSGRSPGEGDGWQPTPVFLPRESYGQRKPGGLQSRE